MSDIFNSVPEGDPVEQQEHMNKLEKEQIITAHTPSAASLRKKKRGTAVFFFIILLSVGAACIDYFNISLLPDFSNAADIIPGRAESSTSSNHFFKFQTSAFSSAGGQYIAVLYVEGVIQEKNETYDHEWLCAAVDKFAEDDSNKGILLYIDSPGGTVYHADELYLRLYEYKESGKAVWAYFGPTAASGGYYIACAADKIFANRNTLTGSIGVIAGQSIDVSELLTTYGIKTRTFTAGRNKNMLSLNTPLTLEHIDIMQSIADEAYEQFTAVAAAGRKMDIQKMKEIADGRIYTASQARNVGLIDGILSFEETCDTMTAEIPHTKSLHFKHFRVPAVTTLRDFITGVIRVFEVKTAAERALEMTVLPESIKYPAYFAPMR